MSDHDTGHDTDHDTDLEAARRRVAARQVDLLAALATGAPTPPGFDGPRVAIASEALRRKRARNVEHRSPAYVRHWDDTHPDGPAFPDAFEAWARGRPLGAAGSRDDLVAFDAARRHGPLPLAVAVEVVDARLAGGARLVVVRSAEGPRVIGRRRRGRTGIRTVGRARRTTFPG